MRLSLVALLLVFSLHAVADDLPEYTAIPHIESYATRAEYDEARNDARFRLTRASYESDGLTVFAYVYAPVKRMPGMPIVIFNRGSYTWKEFAGEYLATWHRLGVAGFVVIAPMLRGSGGAGGRDELGGADLDDLLNVKPLLGDAGAVFMYGESRGAMMTYQAIREHFPMRAAAVYGGLTNLGELAAPGAKFEKAARLIFPGYAQKKREIDDRRSALAWPEQFATPVLIMHGGADTDVPPAQSLALAAKLESLGKSYELLIRAGANHVMTGWAAERDAHAIEWFRRHMDQ